VPDNPCSDSYEDGENIENNVPVLMPKINFDRKKLSKKPFILNLNQSRTKVIFFRQPLYYSQNGS